MKRMNVSAVNTRAPLFMFRTVVALTVFLAGFSFFSTVAFAQGVCGGKATWETCESTYGQGDGSQGSIQCAAGERLVYEGNYTDQCVISGATYFHQLPRYACVSDPSCTATPPASSASVSLVANPSSISSGSASTLSWISNGVASCSLNQGIGTVTANAAGSRDVSPTQSATYVISCTTGQPSSGPTWQYSSTDVSDLSCPVSQNTSVYSNVPDCPVNPQGKSCTSGSCKINRANQSTCSIETEIYECVPSGSSSTGSVSAGATVTVSQTPDLVGQVGGAATTSRDQAILLYGGVANEGAGAAEYFPNLIQVCDTNCATVNELLAATAVDSLAPRGWQQVSASYTPVSPAQQFYRVCANNNTNWVNVQTESNYANNCSGWQYLTVGTPAPDLTTSAITPTTATRGRTQTISGTITNIGTAGAGATTGYFQLTAPAPKNSTTASVSIPALSAGVSDLSGFSYSFPTSGTYTVRLCADWLGQVTESDESNNCGPWTNIAVTGAPVSSSVSCTVSTQSTVVGGSVTYDTSTVGAATAPYAWTASDGTSGYGSESTVTRSFATAGSYDMNVTATGASNNPASCPRVTVGVNWCTTGTPTLTITATPERVRAGQTAAISWSATGVNGQDADCTVTGPGISWSSAVSPAPVCSASGSATATINTQSTYTLACDGAQPKTATVNVIPNFQEF